MERICMYTPSSTGGHARYSWELLSALAQHPRSADVRVELATSRDLAADFDSTAYAVHRILPPLRHRKEYSNRLAWIYGRLTHYFRRERFFLNWLKQRPDINGVHFQEWVPWLAACTFRKVRRMGKRIYYTVHNITPHKCPRLVPRGLMHHWIRTSCRLADCLFVHTERLATELAEFLGPDHPPIHVMPHGVWNVNDFVPGPPMQQRLAEKKLLFFGQIRRNKGLHTLLDAVMHLDGYRITIAGDRYEPVYFDEEIQPRLDRLKAAGKQIDLRDRFLPESELPALFAEHSAIVMPYTPEFRAMSGVIYMAMAYEIPVITTAVGGLRDLLEEFRVGVVCRDHTANALSDAIGELCETDCHEQIVQQMKLAKQKYSWTTAAGATLVGYQRAKQARTQTNDCVAAPTPAH
jgi:glycosyltransferase involved in cell wall biosynthesis